MSEQIREQVSAFLDGELPGSETELLLKRLSRDEALRERFGRYALIGECLRGTPGTHLRTGFTLRVNAAIDGESSVAPAGAGPAAARQRWWRPFAGVAVAASVAAVAVVALQQRANTPTVLATNRPAAVVVTVPVAAPVAIPAAAQSREAISYTVPASLAEAPAALPAARLTNYVFAHSKYSSPLGQRDVLSGLIGGEDEPIPAVIAPASPEAPATDSRIAP
jgi:negative regulator of sigma E activity